MMNSARPKIIAVFGASGMLGSDVVDAVRAAGHEPIALDRFACDITVARACENVLHRVGADAAINCAGYTDVNGAESAGDLPFAVNAAGAENVARACARARIRCVYVSTDYVFDGTKDGPYLESDAPNPLSVYGRSKLEGERRTAATARNHAIVRTSWLYGARGDNFVSTMISLARQGQSIKVVADQVGAPTYTRDLAPVLVALALRSETGIFHATNSGACSWHEFAQRIFTLSPTKPAGLTPVATKDYPTPARRPRNSRLADTRLAPIGLAPLPPWPDTLERYLAEMHALATPGG
jgi:dTDP-4-dehydrorhamnose reductase